MASNKQLSATITIGGAVSSSLKSAFGTVAKSTERVGSAITDLTRKQKLLSQSIQTFGRQGKDVESLRAKYAANAVAIDRMRVAQERLNRVESARERNLAKREGYKAGIMGTIAVGATVAVPLKQAMDFEDTLSDIRKVANFETPDGLLKMGQAIQDMSTRLPMAANDIGKIVAAGAQSGIATSELTKFAEAAVKMGVAFDISADEAGQSMAEMRSAFGMTQDQVNILADKINLLGNNTAASAKDILDITQRIGPLGSVAGAASGSIAAMGATLRGMGVQNEIAATGIKNLLLTLSSGKSATKAQQSVFKQLGYTSSAVAKSMQLDADETIRVILAKIAKLPKHMQSAALAQLFGKESIGAIAPMLTQLDQYQKNLAMVNDKAQYFGSTQKEFEAATAKTSAQLQIFNNRVSNLGVTIGSVLLPAFNGILTTVGPVIGKIASLAREYPAVTKAVVATAGALATLSVVTYGAGFAWTFLKGGLLNTVGLFARVAAGATLAGAANTTATAGTTLLGTAFRFVGKSILWAGRALLLNPIGLAVTAIAGGAYLIYKNWEPLKKWFTDLWADITATFDAAIGKIIGLINSVGEKWNTFKTTVSEGVGSAWQNTKDFFRNPFGSDENTGKPAPAAPGLIPLPAPPMANRSGGTQITTNDTYQVNVQPGPGMNEDALARKVAQQLRQQQAVRQRSMMTDGVLSP
ncbi:phage tail tape measure protein [Klebsiella quasipneumoniae]|uniref:phage tail tape measure protein n=1 Tax=Klebsiella quasipneumoniae TaxID=1463165 RepID=UPI0007CC30D8|nr:phage tail tape measure protein [Klebsiella quasipneumoniae]SAY22852.1 phage tail tape measure protein%2C family [Klebsiella quasipneumoniae]